MEDHADVEGRGFVRGVITFRDLQRSLSSVLLAGIALLGSWPAQAAEAVPAKQVLLIHAFGLSAAFRKSFDAAFIETLKADARPIDLQSEALGIERIQPREPSALVDHIADKYADRHIDVIVAVGGEAMEVARVTRPKLGGPAIVGIAFGGESLTDREGRSTGIDALPGYGDTIDLALALRPQTRRVLVVDAAPRNNGGVEAEVRRQARGRPVALDYWRDLPLADVVSRAAAASDDAVVLFLRQRLGDASRDIESIDGLSRVLAASRVPVFVINDVHLGTGAVGGSVWSFDTLARRAGAMVKLIANGTPASEIPIGRMERVAKVDWRQLERWQIEEERLPSGSVVTFRTPSVFEQYRFAIAAAAAVIAIQFVLILGLLAQRASRRRAERANADMRDELSHVTRISALGELTASLAHEVVQPLTAIMSNAQAALLMLRATPIPASQLAETVGDIVNDDRRAVEVLGRIRELAKKGRFRADRVDMNEVVQSVTRIVAADALSREVDISLQLAQQPLPVQGDRVQLQQVVLNLLLNALDAAASANPGKRRIVLETEHLATDEVRVTVRDSGPGLPPGTEEQVFAAFYSTKEAGMGMGLTITRSIVESHGGRIRSANAAGGGAEFLVTLPLLGVAGAT